ncbi:MAG: PEP-CTERM sorting domain-containing protein [Cyanobacteria bacterium P01_A01_bin.114]
MTALKSFLRGLLALPVAGSGFLATTSAEAATFASAEGQFGFSNLSHAPIFINTATDTDTLVVGFEGSVIAESDANAVFNGAARSAFNFTLQEAFGQTGSYFGQAEGESSVLGNFAIAAGDVFSFNFSGLIDLFTLADEPGESASAIAAIEFGVFRNTVDGLIEIDSFLIGGELSTVGDDTFAIAASDGIIPGQLLVEDGSGPERVVESFFAGVTGAYARQFDQDTVLTLAESKRGEATVVADVPEPSSAIALLVLGVPAVLRRKQMA